MIQSESSFLFHSTKEQTKETIAFSINPFRYQQIIQYDHSYCKTMHQ